MLRLVRYHLEYFHADGLECGGVDVMINGVDEMPSCHESAFMSQILFYVHDHHERGLLVFFGGGVVFGLEFKTFHIV